MSQWLMTIGVVAMASVTPTGTEAAKEPSPKTLETAQNVPIEDDLDIEDIDLLELDIPTIVTASRRAQKATTVPYAVSVITARDIRLSGANSIPDALRLATGMDVADLSYATAAVSPRGMHGFLTRMTLVLVDGRQIFDSHFGGTVWGTWPFQLDDIERIEVIRGPGGVTWGANAMNGVINIITRDPEDQLGLSLTTRGGSRGMNRTHLGYAFKEGNLRLRVSAEYEGSDGWRGGSIFGRADDEYRTGKFGLHAIYEPRPEDTLTFSAGAAVVENQFARTPLIGIGWSRQPGAQSEYLMAKWNRKLSDTERFEWVAYINDYYVSPGGRQMDYRYQQFALQFSHTSEPADNHTLTWGVDTRADILDATNSDPQLLERGFVGTGIIGVYVQDTWRFQPKWTLDLGARIDYEFYGGFQPSARASLAYEFDDSSMMYGAVSRAFQMPPAGLRFLDMPLLNGLARAVGNRGVDPTTLIAYELGYRARFFEKLDINMNVYWHDYDEQTSLTPRLGPPGLLTMDFGNRTSMATYGFEFDTKYPVTDNLTLLANYTYQRLQWNADVPFHDTEMLVPPKNKFMIATRYSPTDDLHLSAHLYYVDATRAPNVNFPLGAKHIDPYFRLDLRAEYEFMNDDASFAIGVRNLLDRGHLEGGTLFLNSVESERVVFGEFRLAIR